MYLDSSGFFKNSRNKRVVFDREFDMIEAFRQVLINQWALLYEDVRLMYLAIQIRMYREILGSLYSDVCLAYFLKREMELDASRNQNIDVPFINNIDDSWDFVLGKIQVNLGSVNYIEDFISGYEDYKRIYKSDDIDEIRQWINDIYKVSFRYSGDNKCIGFKYLDDNLELPQKFYVRRYWVKRPYLDGIVKVIPDTISYGSIDYYKYIIDYSTKLSDEVYNTIISEYKLDWLGDLRKLPLCLFENDIFIDFAVQVGLEYDGGIDYKTVKNIEADKLFNRLITLGTSYELVYRFGNHFLISEKKDNVVYRYITDADIVKLTDDAFLKINERRINYGTS